MDMKPSRFTEEQIIGSRKPERRRPICAASTGSAEAFGRGDARQRHAQGNRCKKMVPPAARREAVAQLRVDHPEQSATSYSVGDDSSLEGCTTSRTGGGKFRNSPRQRYQRLALARPCLF